MIRPVHLLVVALVVTGGALLAQEGPAPARRPNPELTADPAPPSSLHPIPAGPLRDPFRGPARLEGTGAAFDPGHPGSPAARALPPVRLLGLLRVKGRAPGALLQVGDGWCVVRAGDRWSAAGFPLEVVEVHATGVRLLLGGEEWEVR